MLNDTGVRVGGHLAEVTSFDAPAPTEDDTRLARMVRDGFVEHVSGRDVKHATEEGGSSWRARVRVVPFPLAEGSEFSRFMVYMTRMADGASHMFAVDDEGTTPEFDDGRPSRCPVLSKRMAHALACIQGVSNTQIFRNNKETWIHQPTDRDVYTTSSVIILEGV